MDLQDEILRQLKAQFDFKSIGDKWLQQGKCPQCGKREAFCAADKPKVVKCSRLENCGWDDSVRNLLSELFEDWSKRFPQTEADPNAAADAYLSHERGLDLQLIRGSYTQEFYQFREKIDGKWIDGPSSSTVRFPLPGGTWWERIIDKPGRFPRKANFQYGGAWQGHWWMPPGVTFETLAAADRILMAEGIFDAVSLTQVGQVAVSLMSVNNWPELALQELRKAIAIGKTPKERPELCFAFDVGKAGVDYTRKFVARAREEGWEAAAMQVRPDGEGTKLDWNDLLLRHQGWKGDPKEAPLADAAFDDYLYNGAITIAESAFKKAKLMLAHTARSSFSMRFGNKIYWVKQKFDGDGRAEDLEVDEISNCAFRILYEERDEIADETNYFLQLDYPNSRPSVKARFSSNACATSGEFEKRLFAFAGIWDGASGQLKSIMRQQTRELKQVTPIHFTGYSEKHNAWVLGDIAVAGGRVVPLNSEKYFELGKSAVKLRSTERILDINFDADRLDHSWIADLWTAWGSKGLITLAFFTMSLFAVQIRSRHKSLGFLEITGVAGAGKSTMVEFCWKLLGRSGYEGFDPNKGTMAGVTRNFQKVANLPVGLIEGNRTETRGHGKQFDWAELLTLYNGRSPRVVGAKSSGTETFEPPFLGSIYLMQNERIDAIPAVLERLMSMGVDKAGWDEDTKAAAIKLESWPIETLSGTIVHIVRQAEKFLPFFFDAFSRHDREMGGRVKGLHNARAIKCHSQLAAGVEALGNLFPVKKAWIEETLKHVDLMALDRQQSSGSDHPAVAEFWEKVDYLIARETEDQHAQGNSINQHRKPDEFIAVNLTMFEAHCRTANLQPPRMDELKRHLRNAKSRKFEATKNVNNPADRQSHCWVFKQVGSGAKLPI